MNLSESRAATGQYSQPIGTMNQIKRGATSALVKPETRGNVGFPRVIVRSGASGRPPLRLPTTESLIPDRIGDATGTRAPTARRDATQRKS